MAKSQKKTLTHNVGEIYKLGNKYYKLLEPIYDTTRKDKVKVEWIQQVLPSINYKGSRQISQILMIDNYKKLRKSKIPFFYIYNKIMKKTKPINKLDINYIKDNIKKNGFKGFLNSINVDSFYLSGRKYYDLHSRLTGNWINIGAGKDKEEVARRFYDYFKNK